MIVSRMMVGYNELLVVAVGGVSARSAFIFIVAEREKVEAHRVVITEVAQAEHFKGYELKYRVED